MRKLEKIGFKIKNKKLSIALAITVLVIVIGVTVGGIICGMQKYGLGGNPGFSKMEDSEKAKYVETIIKNRGGSKSKLSSPVAESGDGYKALAADEDGNEYSVWIDKDGTITDTSYATQYADKASEYITGLLKGEFKNFKVYSKVYILEKPDTKLNENTDAKTFIKSKGVAVMCNIVVGDSVNNLNVEGVKKALGDITGVVNIIAVSNTSNITSYQQTLDYQPIQTLNLGEITTGESVELYTAEVTNE